MTAHLMKKLKFASVSEENKLLRKMTNWQNSQWLRAGGYIHGLKDREKNKAENKFTGEHTAN